MAKSRSVFIVEKDGSLCFKIGWQEKRNRANELVRQFEFKDTLEFVEGGKVYCQPLAFWFKNNTGARFAMHIDDFNNIVSKLTDGFISGTFVTIKRGKYCFVRWISE
jgi:hypothetical protein